MFKGGFEMWTLVDIEKGRVFHFENYLSALNYRQTVDGGVVLKGDGYFVRSMVEQARRVYGQY